MKDTTKSDKEAGSTVCFNVFTGYMSSSGYEDSFAFLLIVYPVIDKNNMKVN